MNGGRRAERNIRRTCGAAGRASVRHRDASWQRYSHWCPGRVRIWEAPLRGLSCGQDRDAYRFFDRMLTSSDDSAS